MREKKRITLRRFDAPQVVKLDHKAVRFEQWRIDHLTCIMESDWRVRVIERSAGRKIVVPGDLAILDPEIAHQRKQEAAGHGVDEWGAALDRILFAHFDCAVALRRHRLEPTGNSQCRRYGRRQLSLEFRRAAEFERHRFSFVRHEDSPLTSVSVAPSRLSIDLKHDQQKCAAVSVQIMLAQKPKAQRMRSVARAARSQRQEIADMLDTKPTFMSSQWRFSGEQGLHLAAGLRR